MSEIFNTLKKTIYGNGVNNVEILSSKEELETVSKVLKLEYVGIDQQIDEIIEYIKPWLLFKEKLNKPHVISLFGMTGVGKTEVVNRLIELLNLKFHTYRIICDGSLNINPLYPLISNANQQTVSPCIIFDEFQYLSSKMEGGNSKEKKNPVIWDFIDTGIIHSDEHIRDGVIFDIKIILESLLYFGIEDEFKNLIFKYTEEQFDLILKKSNYIFSDKDGGSIVKKIRGLVKNISINDYLMQAIERCCSSNNSSHTYQFNDSLIMKIGETLKMYNILVNEDYISEIKRMNFHEFYELIDFIYDRIIMSNKKAIIDYSKSLIFIIGNLDDCFKVSNNPDISADYNHELTKKVNIVGVKEALRKLFSPEQVARLGNNFVIYPALTSKSYRKIISNLLDKITDDCKNLYQITVIFDPTINSLLYKEGVYPSQGVRPIKSTVNNLILANVINSMVYKDEYGIECDYIYYRYKNKKIIAEYYKRDCNAGNCDCDDEGRRRATMVNSSSFKVSLKLDELRKPIDNDIQYVIAVHEAGHAIANILLKNELPLYVCSVTAQTFPSGFNLMPIDEWNIENKETILKDVQIYMAGRAAEEIVFGDKLISSGCGGDIRCANTRLFDAYRTNGLGDSLLLRGVGIIDNCMAKEYETDNIQKKVDEELGWALHDVRELLLTEKKLLYHLALYLIKNSSISPKKMLTIIKKYATDIDIDKLQLTKKNYGYKEKFKEFNV